MNSFKDKSSTFKINLTQSLSLKMHQELNRVMMKTMRMTMRMRVRKAKMKMRRNRLFSMKENLMIH